MTEQELLRLIIYYLGIMTVAGMGVWVRIEIQMSRFETLLNEINERRHHRRNGGE